MNPRSQPAQPDRARSRTCAAALALTLACAGILTGRARATDDPDTTRETMQRVFEAVASLAPVEFSSSTNTWKTQQTSVKATLDVLAQASEQLASLGRQQDESFRFLSASLAAQTRMLQWQVQRRDYASASHYTERLVETCVACHVRLPTTRPDFAKTLLQRVDREVLPPFVEASLETAGRQFDAALAIYERAFASEADVFASADLPDALASYLIVTLRVQRDPERAARGLALLARHDNLAAQFELNLKTWARALRELRPALHAPPTLERAREILDAGHALSEFPLDSADEIHAVVASSVLFRYLEAKRPEGADLAQALYLLARTEAFTRRTFETSEASSYLERAIRAAPHTAIAERAYARLELATLLQYSGPFGVEFPDDVRLWLEELRERSRSERRPRTPAPGESAATHTQRSTL